MKLLIFSLGVILGRPWKRVAREVRSEASARIVHHLHLKSSVVSIDHVHVEGLCVHQVLH